jgi:putative transcriptional regulator
VPADPRKSKRPTRLRGRLLLADPSLGGGVFDRSVVLVTHHSPQEGAHGLVLNHPTEHTVGDLLKGPEFEAIRSIRVFQGGPVDVGELKFAAFSWNASRGLRIDGPMPLDAVVAANRRPGTLVRAFIGYSGWSPGQLEGEIDRNSWFVVKPENDLLGLEHARPLWVELMRRISPFHHILSAAPADPWRN